MAKVCDKFSGIRGPPGFCRSFGRGTPTGPFVKPGKFKTSEIHRMLRLRTTTFLFNECSSLASIKYEALKAVNNATVLCLARELTVAQRAVHVAQVQMGIRTFTEECPISELVLNLFFFVKIARQNTYWGPSNARHMFTFEG
jgi:hypothetical protein